MAELKLKTRDEIDPKNKWARNNIRGKMIKAYLILKLDFYSS